MVEMVVQVAMWKIQTGIVVVKKHQINGNQILKRL
ncbi:hypothetical protein Alsa4_CDS0021 [Staphylococcus phage Alsa_4]|nr:hypothetical protein Alsa4_CDS0021 [Staphylococcus phage Alsa_4]